ncbi:hypothetical protein D3C75_722490 [compost metagenome]
MIYPQRISILIRKTGFGKSLKFPFVQHPGALMGREIPHMQLIDYSIGRVRQLRRLIPVPRRRVGIPQIYNR